uniref:Chymotrypsin-like elastase family member 1 n=1 Tax=Aceria tosichella TaxID=561515 RepID=A0A6G1SM90_9ACAR
MMRKKQEPSLVFVLGRKRFLFFAPAKKIILISLIIVLFDRVTCLANNQQLQQQQCQQCDAPQAPPALAPGSIKLNEQVGVVQASELGGECREKDSITSLASSSTTITATNNLDKRQQQQRQQPTPSHYPSDSRQSEIRLLGISGGADDDSSEASKCESKTATDKPRREAKYMIDQSTKVIHVDKSNESGVLWGVINNNNASSSPSPGSGAEATRTKRALAQSDNTFDDSAETKLTGENSVATNYSVFLISHHKEHFAILIDIESVDFEPIINCEYQELRFTIVGEISKQLLERKNQSNSTGDTVLGTDSAGSPISNDELAESNQQSSEQVDDLGGGEPKDDDDDESQQAADLSGQPPLPVSEAMALLMNAPLNKTILDESGDVNDFRLIDTTIDYLYEETCRELQQQQQQQHRQLDGTTRSPADGGEHQPRSRPKLGRQRRKHRSKSKRRKRKRLSANRCDHNDAQFRELLANKLNNHLEWDDFKFVCGKTRQLIIPMRSLKLSVSSDEFSPRSSFSIRYKFVSDPKELPTWDNGKYYCRNRRVIDLSLKCDGYDDCGDASDESVKICGYPSGRASSKKESSPSRNDKSSYPNRNHRNLASGLNDEAGAQLSKQNSNHHRHSSAPASSSSPPVSQRRKLTYFNGDVLNCCQSSDWLNALGQNQPGQTLNLQTLIGESMKLFSGPLFAPTKSSSGRLKRVKRIVGGSEAHRGSWPGQVSLQYEILEPLCHFCAGTLIHPQYVLTAGHCITKDGLARGIKVVLGAHDLRQTNGSNIQERYVDDAQVYPGVNVRHLSSEWENDMNNDIALLRLNAPVLITQHTAPACLPLFNTPLPVNTTCHSIGWGQTHGSGSSNLLKHLPLRVVDSSECSNKLIERDGENGDENEDDKNGASPRVKESALERRQHFQRKSKGRYASSFETSGLDTYSNQTMVCVNNDHGHGICQGDSGGPLYCERVTSSGEHCKEIYGVASFIIQYATVGAMCAVENLPGIFSEVSSKTEWISSTIKMFEQTYRLKYAQNK